MAGKPGESSVHPKNVYFPIEKLKIIKERTSCDAASHTACYLLKITIEELKIVKTC